MEFYQLKLFKAVAEARTLTEAAEVVHVTQPSLSRAVKKLETECGVELFDRVGRNLVLNENGKVFLAAANRAIDAASAVKREVDSFVRTRERTVNLYAPVPMGDEEVVLYEFRRRHPDIHLRVGCVPSERLLDEVPDLTFFSSPIVHHGENYLLLGEERVVLAVPAGDPLAKAPAVRLSDMAQKDFLCSMPCSFRDLVDGMFMEVGFEPHIVLETQSCRCIMDSVGRGYGYALAPSVTWFAGAVSGVAGVPLSDVRRKRYLYLKWAKGVELPPAAKLFRDFCVEHYGRVAPLQEELAG